MQSQNHEDLTYHTRSSHSHNSSRLSQDLGNVPRGRSMVLLLVQRHLARKQRRLQHQTQHRLSAAQRTPHRRSLLRLQQGASPFLRDGATDAVHEGRLFTSILVVVRMAMFVLTRRILRRHVRGGRLILMVGRMGERLFLLNKEKRTLLLQLRIWAGEN